MHEQPKLSHSMSADGLATLVADSMPQPEECNIQQSKMTPQAASLLKETLFELLKAGDINNDEQIDFDEFQKMISKFLPDMSEDKMREIFANFDTNANGSISYVEFLDDFNFKSFLDHCW